MLDVSDVSEHDSEVPAYLHLQPEYCSDQVDAGSKGSEGPRSVTSTQFRISQN